MRDRVELMVVVVITAVSASSLLVAAEVQAADLDGTWIEIAPERDRVGYQPPFEPMTLKISGNAMTELYGERIVRQSLFKRTDEGERKGMDLMTVVDGEFWLTRALYKIEGDTLTICESARDEPRPTELRRWESSQERLVLFRRFKRQDTRAQPK
jgi:uncharacterized protein (TIGR03067 family)